MALTSQIKRPEAKARLRETIAEGRKLTAAHVHSRTRHQNGPHPDRRLPDRKRTSTPSLARKTHFVFGYRPTHRSRIFFIDRLLRGPHRLKSLPTKSMSRDEHPERHIRKTKASIGQQAFALQPVCTRGRMESAI